MVIEMDMMLLPVAQAASANALNGSAGRQHPRAAALHS
jgi:hypothetical protein